MQKNSRYPMHGYWPSENSAMVCGAKTRTGAACKNRPVTGKQRCRMHGGASPSGEGHWNYKHGFYSKEERRKRAEARRFMRMLLKNF